MNPVVEVQEITNEQVKREVSEYNPRGVNLGGKHDASAAVAEANVNELIGRIRESEGRKFLLVWEGNKVPRGAHVLEHERSWTQNGEVRTTSRETIGTYDRLVEFGGASGTEQKMLIYLFQKRG